MLLQKTSIYCMEYSLYTKEIWGDRPKESESMEQSLHCKVGMVHCLEKGHAVGQLGAWEVPKVAILVGLPKSLRL